MKTGIAILLAVVLLAVPHPAEAAVAISLAPAAQSPTRATQFIFSGTLTNTSATEKVFLNDLQTQLSASATGVLALETNTFFANVPGILLPGETYTGIIFGMEINAMAAPDNYSGTLVVKGGVDIGANGDLVSASFAIFSPTVSIVATDASASEMGPDAGSISIRRTGSTALALSVPCTISGNAINGTTYAAIPTTTVIPIGAASAAIPVTPLPDNVAQGDRIATLTLDASPAFYRGATVTASVTIHDKPVDQWRWEKFGAAANDPEAQDLADWESDGIQNLVEYALNLDPRAAAIDSLPQAGTINGYATFSYVPNAAATDLTYSVEACADLVSWSTAQIVPVVIANRVPPNRVTVRYDIPSSSLDGIFFRLKITRLGVTP